MKHKIVTISESHDEKFLRTKTKEFDIARLTDKKEARIVKELIREMRDTMKKANGVGLSANQIGINERFFVAQVPDAQGNQKFYAIFNPEIVKKSKETETVEEGCLSVPGSYGPTERNYEVTLTGYDIRGKKVKIKAWGLLARVFQHEMGHLDGKLFTDIAKEIYTLTAEGNVVKI